MSRDKINKLVKPHGCWWRPKDSRGRLPNPARSLESAQVWKKRKRWPNLNFAISQNTVSAATKLKKEGLYRAVCYTLLHLLTLCGTCSVDDTCRCRLPLPLHKIVFVFICCGNFWICSFFIFVCYLEWIFFLFVIFIYSFFQLLLRNLSTALIFQNIFARAC